MWYQLTSKQTRSSETAYGNKQVGAFKQLTRYTLDLGGRTVDCRWAESACALSQMNPGRELSTPPPTEGKTFSATSTLLCMYKELHARNVCVGCRNPTVRDASTCSCYRNQLREMYVNIPGILSNEMHIPGILSYEMHLHVHVTEISCARCL